MLERTHIVQSVSQLDDDDPHILCHSQKHLAVAFQLAFLFGVAFQLAQFGDAIDQKADFFTEII